MSRDQASAGRGGITAATRRGHKRWARRQALEKQRSLRQRVAELQRREKELDRRYSVAFEKACRSESRSAAAVARAFDEADALMNALLAVQTELRQTQTKLGAAP